MLIPQDSPCPVCGHPRRDHEMSAEHFIERCKQCGCSDTMIDNAIVYDLGADPTPFDWRFALVTFVMQLDDEDGLFTDSIEKWKPGYLVSPAEKRDLRAVELVVRELWSKHAPMPPPAVSAKSRNIAAENAAVDEYQNEVMKLKGAILRLVVSEEWKSYFPRDEHEMIEQARQLIILHGGDRAV